MPRLATCRVIVDAEPQSGAWNMAVDEVLLEAAARAGICTVRWYQWRRPTVSLGYFQKPEELEPALRRPEVDVVRRLTGGGAILHHHEWTYSCAVPLTAGVIGHPYDLYELVHGRLIDWFRDEWGLELALRGSGARGPNEPPLCFLRADPRDVVARSRKVIGSAQRRRRGGLLQHGSIVLRQSEFAPAVLGLCDLYPDWRPHPRDATAAWRLAELLAETPRGEQLTPSERAAATQLATTAYAPISVPTEIAAPSTT